MWRGIAAAMFLAGIALPALAQFTVFYVPAPAAGAAFTGVGDTLSGAKGHWGIIAYSAASRGSNMLNLCNVGDVACADVATNATTGLVSSTQVVGAITCGTGANLCTVKKMYDDSGALFCPSSTACTLDFVGGGSRPTFVPNCAGSLPCIQFASGQHLQNLTDWSGTMSQPISEVGSISIPANPGGFSAFFGLATASVQIGVDSSGHAFNYNGNVLSSSGTLTANTFYSVIGTQTGSSNGSISINGSTTTGTVGAFSATSKFDVGYDGSGDFFIGNLLEVGIYNSTFSGTDITNLTSTQRTNGGF